MSAQTATQTPAAAQPPAKNLTPAQTAKPYGTAAKAAASRTAKKAEPAPAADAAKNDEATKAIEKLETKLKAINANNIARVANSHLSSNDDKLHPLLSLKTGAPIEKFPITSSGITKINLAHLDTILNSLDAERTGNEEAKRERLRMQIGLKPTPA